MICTKIWNQLQIVMGYLDDIQGLLCDDRSKELFKQMRDAIKAFRCHVYMGVADEFRARTSERLS